MVSIAQPVARKPTGQRPAVGRRVAWGWPRDLLSWLSENVVGRRRISAARERVLELARVAPEDNVLRLGRDSDVRRPDNTPFADETFDAVVGVMPFYRFSDDHTRRSLAEVARVLKPGGRLAIADYQRGSVELAILFAQAGFIAIESGDLRFPRMPMLPGGVYTVGRKG